MTTLEAIVTHGLSIRQIPLEVVSLWTCRPDTVGSEVLKRKCENINYKPFKARHAGNPMYEFDDVNEIAYRFISVIKEVKTPKFGDHWMCKQVNSTDSTVLWNLTKDNLAATLDESVALFLTKL